MEKRGPITAEDTALVKRYLIVPMILDAFERDKQIIESGLFKSPTLYTDLIDKAMDQATKELTYLRRAFKEHGIKVYDERKTRKGVEAKYLYRGYHKEMSMLWTFISAEATMLRRLLLGLNIDTYIDQSIPEVMRQVPNLYSRLPSHPRDNNS